MIPLNKEIRLMQRLYFGEGLKIRKISARMNAPYATVYEHTRLVERGFERPCDYIKYLALENGYSSTFEYKRDLSRRKQKIPKYQRFSKLINTKLEELNKKGSWLAKKLHVSKESISLYRNAESIPGPKKLKKLCSFLNIDNETLENILNDHLL